jgi:hypothetical protein
MKYAMKMVLIPESEYRKLKPDDDQKMQNILSGKHDYKAATELTQLFGHQLRKTKPNPKTELDDSKILEHLPILYHDKVSKFLKQLTRYGLRWTDNYQLISKSGQVIGNIIQLLKETFVASRRAKHQKPQSKPHGWQHFMSEIVNASISPSIFTKKSTREDVEKAFEQQKPTPLAQSWEIF